MNENLIQSLNAYTNVLEQKLSALEQRVALLEQQLAANSNTDQDVVKLITQLQERISTLESRPMTTEEAEPEVEVELVLDEDEQEDEPVAAPEPEQEQVTESTPEPIVETEPVVAPEPVAESVPVTEPEPVVEPEPAPVAAPQPAPQAEVHHEQPKMSKGTPLQTSLFGEAVQDIRHAISLGDRFLFQRELFAGKGELMQKTLDEINALDSLEEALEYVNQHFDWDQDSHAAQLFENVLRRRFN